MVPIPNGETFSPVPVTDADFSFLDMGRWKNMSHCGQIWYVVPVSQKNKLLLYLKIVRSYRFLAINPMLALLLGASDYNIFTVVKIVLYDVGYLRINDDFGWFLDPIFSKIIPKLCGPEGNDMQLAFFKGIKIVYNLQIPLVYHAVVDNYIVVR